MKEMSDGDESDRGRRQYHQCIISVSARHLGRYPAQHLIYLCKLALGASVDQVVCNAFFALP